MADPKDPINEVEEKQDQLEDQQLDEVSGGGESYGYQDNSGA